MGQTWRSKDKEGDAEMPDPSGLTDDDLKAALLEHGVKVGPIVASTRAVYERKLRKLLQSDGRGCLNGGEQGVMYSDSEEEDENGEQEDEESGSGGEETNEQLEQAQQGSSQAFSITQMVEEMESSRSHSMSVDTERDLNGCNEQEHWPRSNGLDTSTLNKDSMNNQSLYYTPKASTYDWEMKISQQPVKYTFRNKLPNTNATPTRIYATCRRPIKGAAGRPLQYTYPDTPASPTTLERREVERRLVPVQLQILVFVVVACLLYLIYVCVEDDWDSTFVALLDILNQGSDSEGLSLQVETRDAPAPSELE